MALLTNHFQSSLPAFPSKLIPLKLNKELRLKHCVIKFGAFETLDTCSGHKHDISLRVGFPHFCFPKFKSFRLSSFRGSAQNDGSGGGRSGNVSQSSVKLSHGPKEREDTIAESTNGCDIPISHAPGTNGNVAGSAAIHKLFTNGCDIPISHAPGTNGNVAGSAAIHKLFRKWLTMLTTHSSDQLVDEILGEGPPPRGISGTKNETRMEKRSSILKTLCCHFWNLDAILKFPLMILVPVYLAINVTYGREVSKELMPLWVLGPLLIALYIKMLRGLCSLYAFTFKQTVNIAKNFPMYYTIACDYVASGNLREDIAAQVWQPAVDIKTLDYKELLRRKFSEFQEWLLERYLDFVESIWPYYCRTIRFLKMANLI